MLEFFYWP